MAEKKKKNTDRNVILKRDIPCAFLKDMVIFPESTVQFDIDAHEYNGRWFNEIRAYNVTRGQVQSVAPGAATFPPAGGATAPFPPAQEPASEGSADDLPF